MRSPVYDGLVAPAVVAALTAVAGLAFDAEIALAVLGVGSVGIVAIHLWNLERLRRWAESPLDADVPEGRGAWRDAFAALYRRVRARTRHQADLAARIERFRSAAEALPDGMVILDAANRVQWANARAQAHLGVELAQDFGRPLGNLARQPALARYLETGDFTEAVEFESKREGSARLSVQVVPFGAEEKLLISHDVTQLEAVARMRRDFIANVSHELKTPLTVVAGFIETLQDVELEPAQRERCLQLMAEQARGMRRLVDDLLTLSALESEPSASTEAAFPIAPLLEEVLVSAKGLSAGRHAVVLDPGDAAWVHGARDEIASAFGNLVSNAVRYTPEDGTIALAWRIDEHGRGVFSVADSGIGIAAEHIPRLTERFYRVDRSRSRATGGTGLGLAIVKHVLLRHQAELDVTSEPGQGSTFSVLLPAKRVRRAAGTPEAREARQATAPAVADAAPAPPADAANPRAATSS